MEIRMKELGLTINFIGIVFVVLFLFFYFANFPSIYEREEFVRIIGGDHGPTSVFLTAKINHKYLVFPFGFLAIFIFNFYYFYKECKK